MQSNVPVHVVVLAAGRGSRLGALGEETPKWLLEVGERTIAARHLQGVRDAGDHVASVRVVTGHGAASIERFLAEDPSADAGQPVEALFNEHFADWNNWYSVLLALRALDGRDGAVAILNADLLIDPDWVASFLREAAASTEEALLAVDLERDLTDESMKVELDGDGHLTRIGKVGIDPGAGEYVGMLMVRGEPLARLRAALEAFEGVPEAVDEWYEGAIGRTAADGAPWSVWPMPGGSWVEIDDDDDLAMGMGMASS